MIAKVELLGHLYRLAGAEKQVVRCDGDKCSIREVLRQLEIPEGEVGYLTVNGLAAGLDSGVSDGDEIVVIPAMHGG